MQWCQKDLMEGHHETKRKQYKGDTQKCYEIHEINHDKAGSLCMVYFFTGWATA